MKLNKKFMSLIAALLLSVGVLTACGNDSNDADNNNDQETQEEATEENGDTDSVSAASESTDPEDLIGVMTYGANWMFAAGADMELEEDLIIEGEHFRRNDSETELARKLALYAQVREENEETGEMESVVTDEFTLTVPNIIVKSPSLLIQHGTVDGNIIVEAEGFVINETNVTGDLVFASQELMDGSEFDASLVAGEVRVAE